VAVQSPGLVQIPAAAGEPESYEPRTRHGSAGTSPAGLAFRRFYKNKLAVACLVILVVACVAAAFAPLLSRYDPMTLDLGAPQLDAGPSSAHWLGTDGLGRDEFTRLLYGMRVPLFVAFAGAFLCTLIGAFTGILAGLHEGWIDEVLTRGTEMVFVVPGILLLILCVSLFGRALDGALGVYGRVVMITVFIATDSWPVIMRLARAETLRLKHEPFVEAGFLCGASTLRLMRRHLLPNMFGILMVQGGFLISGFIYISAALAILGLGDPSIPDVGHMIVDGNSTYPLNPVEMLAPCAVITVLSLAATFLGDGLRDAFDTRTG
jgi:ABC-type dipeptide/oligopeptide/nickel transport system permease subunit